ncbi:MAG: hypothetical protein NXI10_09585 [bacterium]|nr:hypothetical protein [bacterium]
MKDNKENQKVVITMNGKPFKVPPGGTLGVLALGNIGVRAIREANKKYKEEIQNGKEEA